jgi:glyoxylase-like metal-dependent hydrolase (beta-lactamase superfamily II)
VSDPQIHTIDLQFQTFPNVIAAYLIPHDHGAVLIESGPTTTIETLRRAVDAHGLTLSDITDLLLTHIHLDHAGAAGWLAREGIRVHVHHRGAPHLVNPSRLLASASRIYGEAMDRLWGEVVPVPGDQVFPLVDGDVVQVGGLLFQVYDTPGHASHHMSYGLNGVCFSGDVGGVRLPSHDHLELPMPPPELHLEKWRRSVTRLLALNLSTIAPTHFGPYGDPDRHLHAVQDALASVGSWIKGATADAPSQAEFEARFLQWAGENPFGRGDDGKRDPDLEIVNPLFMSAHGLYRYWQKHL